MSLVLLLLGTPAAAQPSIPPEGALILTVGLSTGTALVPIAQGVLPVICEVAP